MIFLKFSTGEKIPVKGTIKYQMVNDMFNDDVLVGDGSYPFSAARTPALDRLMQHAHRHEVSKFTSKFNNVELWDGSWMFRRGKLLVKEGGDTYRFTFLSEFGEFLNSFKGTLLKSLDFGGNIDFVTNPQDPGPNGPTESITFMYQLAHGSWPSSKMVFFPYKNPKHFEGATYAKEAHNTLIFGGEPRQGAQGFINYFYPKENVVEMTVDNLVINGYYGDSLYCPSVYLFEIISTIFRNYNIDVGGGFFDIPELKKLVVLSWDLGMHLDFVVGAYDSPNQFPVSLNLKNHMPKKSVADLLIGLKKLFRLQYSFDRVTSTIQINFSKDILSRSPIDCSERLVSIKKRKPSDKTQLNFNYEVKLDDYLAKTSEGDLFSNTEITIKGSVLSVTDLPTTGMSINDAYFVIQERIFYIYSYKENDFNSKEWQAYANLFYGSHPLAEKNYSTTINPAVSRRVDINRGEWQPGASQATVITEYFKVPYIETQGNCSFILDDQRKRFADHDTPIKLLFYRGFYPIATGSSKLYPYGTSDHCDPSGNAVGDYSLEWQGTEGLYNRFHAAVDVFIKQGDEFEAYFDFSRADIDNMDLSKPIQLSSSKFVIIQIDIDLPIKSPVKVILKKIV